MVSVIVPVYRAEKTLERCVGCILAQDYNELELILIDDGSDDGSPSLCDWLAKADSRIRTFHGNNTGAAGARNKGIELARGEWICFVDSDDVLSPVFLSTLVRQLIDNKADIAVCAHEKCLERDIPDVLQTKLFFEAHARKTDTPPALYHGSDGLKALLYQRGMISAPWGMISARSLWNDLTFPAGTAAEDMGTIYRLFAAASTVSYTDRILYGYVQSAGNTVYSTSSERNPDYYMHSHDMLEYVRSSYPECTKAAESRHFSACFQILSETSPEQKDSEFIKKIYGDIKALRRDVLFDREARRRNRVAALAVHFSIPAMHNLLYRKYKKEYPPT